mmetsp:Transcript_5690/g.9784  ORF Transcript_5690/g.9784 Transcript_5690/m.9784 type:complete len:92 (+) Transcript_5690:454-729(+)
MTKPESSGLLKGGGGIHEMICPAINRSVPFFEIHDDPEISVNRRLLEQFKIMNKEEVDHDNRGNHVPGTDEVPDGVYYINEASEERLNYKF